MARVPIRCTVVALVLMLTISDLHGNLPMSLVFPLGVFDQSRITGVKRCASLSHQSIQDLNIFVLLSSLPRQQRFESGLSYEGLASMRSPAIGDDFPVGAWESSVEGTAPLWLRFRRSHARQYKAPRCRGPAGPSSLL